MRDVDNVIIILSILLILLKVKASTSMSINKL